MGVARAYMYMQMCFVCIRVGLNKYNYKYIGRLKYKIQILFLEYFNY